MQARGDRHPTELADLFGKRLVVASETDQGRKLNEAMVKDLTGGEPIKARGMREDFWQFDPTHKVLLLTNHKPVVAGTDEGIWRRVRLVPFGVTFWDPDGPTSQGKDLPPELRQDKQLGEKLRAEAEGILAWMVQGCLGWQHHGLTLPEPVRAATEGYRQSEDQLAQFLAECCTVAKDDAYRVRSRDLYAAYRKWAESLGEEPASNKAFGDAMTEKGYQRKTSNGKWYLGVALRPDEPDE